MRQLVYPPSSTFTACGRYSARVGTSCCRWTVSRIVECLSRYSNHLNSDPLEGKIDPSAIRWLSNFWEWFNSYEHKDEPFPQIRNLPLFPSTKGLKRADSAIFKLRGEHHAYTMGYLALGVPFFLREFSELAHVVLQRYGLAKLISDILVLLDSLTPTNTAQLSQPNYESILKHLVSGLDDSINQENVQCLRKLRSFQFWHLQ